MGKGVKRTLPLLLLMLFVLAFTGGTAAAEPTTDQAGAEKQETVISLFTDVAENDSNMLL